MGFLEKEENSINMIDGRFRSDIMDSEPSQYNICVYRLLKKTGFRCAYCAKKLTVKSAEKEHIIPKSKGGAGGVKSGNIVPSCRSCNRRKGVFSLDEFRVRFFGNTDELFHFEKQRI